MTDNNGQVIYMSIEQARDYVERVAKRCGEWWGYDMGANEQEAMADMLAECGIGIDDILDVAYIADNYAVNGERYYSRGGAYYDSPDCINDTYPYQGEPEYMFCWVDDVLRVR